MRNKFWIVHLLYIFLHISRDAAQSSYTSSAKNLFTSLTIGYNADIRPDSNVPVLISFAVSTFNNLDTRTEQFSITGWFSLSWTDNSYKWNPSTNGNINYIFLTKYYCWRPQIAIYNAVDNPEILNDDGQQMRVKSDGTVLWEPGGMFKVNCVVDATNFPFDKHECSLSLTSLVYDDTEVTISHFSDNIKMDSLKNSAEWTVTDTSTETGSHLDGSSAFSKALLRFTFKLERRSFFYVWTLLVPYILISSLGLVVFFLPPTDGEKLTFSTTVILLVAVYFVIFSILIAMPMGKFPTIGIYFFLLLIINALELLSTVIVKRMQRNENEERPVTDQAQTIARTFLARLSCYHNGDTHNKIDYGNRNRSPIRFPMPKNTRVSPSSLQSVSPESIRPKKPDIDFDRIKSAASTRTPSDLTISSDAASTLQLQLSMAEYSWGDIASMVDRICLAVCLKLVVLLTAIFMTILLVSAD